MARAAYCQLYDATLAASIMPVTESDVEASFGRTQILMAGDPLQPPLVALHGRSLSATLWLGYSIPTTCGMTSPRCVKRRATASSSWTPCWAARSRIGRNEWPGWAYH
jgi:hypothetical protein